MRRTCRQRVCIASTRALHCVNACLALRQAVASTPNSHAKRSLSGLDLASRARRSQHRRRFGAPETHHGTHAGPPSPSRRTKRERRARDHALQVRCIRALCIVEREYAREGSVCKRSTDCEGTAVLRANEWGYYRGFWVSLSSGNFLEVRLSLWNGDSVEMREVEKNYKKYVDSPSRKGWLTEKRNV